MDAVNDVAPQGGPTDPATGGQFRPPRRIPSGVRALGVEDWNLGGYLAPRATSGEHRLVACVADPGLWSMAEGFRRYAIKLGARPDAPAHLGDLDRDVLDRMGQIILRDRKLRWSIVQRGFWVHGVGNLRDYLRAAEPFTMDGRAGLIRCPTLLTAAENDPLAVGARALFDALRCAKELIRFTAAEGAGDHCEMGNRSLLTRRVLDWLDAVLA
jgi:pimeloyl-ACP methyl ester carboxylesterase